METLPAPTALDLFTQEQLDEFLGLIRDGIGRHVAARRIGATGTTMRRLANPSRDPEFAAAYEAAEEEGAAFYRDRLRAEARSRALGGSDRMLEVELASHGDPELYGHLRRDRMRVNGTVQHEHAVTIALDPAVLDTWPPEKLEAFSAYLDELANTVEGEARELPAA